MPGSPVTRRLEIPGHLRTPGLAFINLEDLESLEPHFERPKLEMLGDVGITGPKICRYNHSWGDPQQPWRASKLVLDVLVHSSRGQQPILCLQVVGWGNAWEALCSTLQRPQLALSMRTLPNLSAATCGGGSPTLAGRFKAG